MGCGYGRDRCVSVGMGGETELVQSTMGSTPAFGQFLARSAQDRSGGLTPEWPQALEYHPLTVISVDSVLIFRSDAMFMPGDTEMAATLHLPRWNLCAFHVTLRTEPQLTKPKAYRN